jgi:hypothetical protein
VPGLLQSRLDLACEPSATRYALQHTKDVLPRWGIPHGVADDASLVVAELITNAVRHAGGASKPFDPEQGQPKVRGCTLVLWVLNGYLLVCVYDQDDERPVLRDFSLDAESGRGLQLVAGLSEGRWGYTFLSPQPGKLIWAKLRIFGGAHQGEPSTSVSRAAPSPAHQNLDHPPQATGLRAAAST